jgi:hypothetical protein
LILTLQVRVYVFISSEMALWKTDLPMVRYAGSMQEVLPTNDGDVECLVERLMRLMERFLETLNLYGLVQIFIVLRFRSKIPYSTL